MGAGSPIHNLEVWFMKNNDLQQLYRHILEKFWINYMGKWLNIR